MTSTVETSENATNWVRKPGPHKLSARQLTGIILTLVMFAGLWTAAVTSYTDQPASIEPSPITASEGVQVKLRPNSFNSGSEDLGIQLQLQQFGGLADSRGFLLQNIALRIVGNANVQVIKFAQGDPLSKKDIVVQIDGDATEYPFDHYVGEFSLDAEKTLANGTQVPLALSVGTKRAETGWFTQFAVQPVTSNESKISIVTMKRERFHVSFALMLGLLLLLLAGIAVSVGFLCITNRRSSDPSLIGWLGGILVAMTLSRRMMPGDPPLGCQIDVKIFSWALALGIIAIGLAMTAWVRQSRAALLSRK